MIFTLLIYFISVEKLSSQNYIKGNVSTLIGFPHVGSEFRIGKKTTFQIDLFTSLWKSINNGPVKILMIIPESRYYYKSIDKGLYTGLHIGGAYYNLKRWDYKNLEYNQKGYSVLYGMSLGYKQEISKKISIDIFIGGGNQQGFYKGYDSQGNRYESATKYNKSGEWLIYRGGIMFTYLI